MDLTSLSLSLLSGLSQHSPTILQKKWRHLSCGDLVIRSSMPCTWSVQASTYNTEGITHHSLEAKHTLQDSKSSPLRFWHQTTANEIARQLMSYVLQASTECFAVLWVLHIKWIQKKKRTKIFSHYILNWRIISKCHHNTKKLLPAICSRPPPHQLVGCGHPWYMHDRGPFHNWPVVFWEVGFAGDKSHFTPERSSGSEPWLGTMHAACRREQWAKFLLHTL